MGLLILRLKVEWRWGHRDLQHHVCQGWYYVGVVESNVIQIQCYLRPHYHSPDSQERENYLGLDPIILPVNASLLEYIPLCDQIQCLIFNAVLVHLFFLRCARLEWWLSKVAKWEQQFLSILFSLLLLPSARTDTISKELVPQSSGSVFSVSCVSTLAFWSNAILCPPPIFSLDHWFLKLLKHWKCAQKGLWFH